MDAWTHGDMAVRSKELAQAWLPSVDSSNRKSGTFLSCTRFSLFFGLAYHFEFLVILQQCNSKKLFAAGNRYFLINVPSLI